MSSTAPMTDPERVVLDAAALRRRQLCVAFLHGSARSWRVRRRIWPAAVAGLLLMAIAIAAMAVAAAFAAQQQLDRERQSLSIAGAATAPAPSAHRSRAPASAHDRVIAGAI